MKYPTRFGLKSLVCLMIVAGCLCRLGSWLFGRPASVEDVLRRLPTVATGSDPATVRRTLGIEREPDSESISRLNADPSAPPRCLYQHWQLACDYDLIVFYRRDWPDRLGLLSAFVTKKSEGVEGFVSERITDDFWFTIQK